MGNMARPTSNNADEWMMWFFEYAGYGAHFLGVQIAEAIDDHVARTEFLDRAQTVRMMRTDADHAVCVGGEWDGWLMWKHPDGQWVSVRKLDAEYPDAGAGSGSVPSVHLAALQSREHND